MNREPGTADQAAPGSVLIWDRVAANKRETWLLMFLFVLLVGGFATAIVFAFGGNIGILGIVGIMLIGYAIFSYYASSSVVLNIAGAREVTKEEEWEFVRRVENLAIGAGLPKPRTWVMDDPSPNAFATGRDPEHSHIVVTTGLLEKLEPAELEGVLAHEMMHIGNYDIRVMTISVLLVGLVALMSDIALRMTFFRGMAGGRGGGGRGGGPVALIMLLVVIVAAIVAPLIAQLIKLAISRRREYLADASGALLNRNPEALARALEKISADPEPLDRANKATAHMYIYNPLKGKKLNGLFNTHPPAEERIRILRSM